MNWKNKNNLNINHIEIILWDYISLETASADTLDQSLWAPLNQLHHLVWVGVPILSGCGFCGWRGVAIGLGHLGVPWGWVSWGVRRWGCDLGLDGVLVTLDAVSSLVAACGAAGDACAGGRRLPAWRPHCSGGGPGGVWGSGGALPPGWGYGWAWGAWVLVGVPPGAWVVHALGPALGWGSSMHRCLRRGGPIEAG